MANKNFEIKNGLTVAGTERITAAGAGSLTNLTLSGNLTVQGTTVTLDASTLQVADKNIVLNYHASNDTSSASGGAGITIQDAVNGTTDATILWDASDDEFDFSHGINIPNLKVSGGQGTDGQLLTSTGSGVAWEDAPASGPTFKAFGTSSIMVGDSTTGTINAADYNTGLGIDIFKYLTTGDKNTVLGFEAGMSLLTHNENTLIGYQAGKLLGNGAESWEAQRNTFIGAGAGRDVDEGSKNIAIGYEAMMSSTSTSTHDIAIGYQAMQYRASSIGDSIAIGVSAHRGVNGGNLNANRNVAVGSYTLEIVETYGQQNTAVGWYTGKGVTSGNSNTLIGSEAGEAVSTGQKNTLIGYQAGELITSGGFNVVLGGYDGNEGGLDIRTASNRVVISDGAGNIRMYIDNTGDVLIGSSTNLNVLSGTPKIQIGDGTGHSSIQWYSGTGSVAGLYFGDATSGAGRYDGYIEYRHNSNEMAFRTNGAERLKIGSDGLAEFTSTRNEWAMRLTSASNRGGIVFDKPGTTSIMGSVLMLSADETFRLGTASNYHVRMDQSGNTYMGNASTTRFTQNGNLSVNTTTANSGITSGTDVRALGPCFANDANSFTMSQEGTGNTDAYLAARGTNGSTRGNIHIGVSVSGGGNFKSGLVVDAEGRSTTPENPAFRARATSGQVLNSSWQQVGYNVLSESRGTGYSTTTSRFTAPVAGWYQFNASWTAVNNSDSDGTFSICINGSYTDLAGSVSMPDTGGSYDGHSVSGCCYLDVNDYVDVRRYSSVATTTRGSNPYGGWFSGFLIG